MSISGDRQNPKIQCRSNFQGLCGVRHRTYETSERHSERLNAAAERLGGGAYLDYRPDEHNPLVVLLIKQDALDYADQLRLRARQTRRAEEYEQFYAAKRKEN